MSKIYLITSGKGGVGKSTLCVSLAACYARAGKKVLVADCDIGLRCDDLMLDMQDRVMLDMQDALNGDAKASEVLLRSRSIPQLYLLPAPQMISAGEVAKKDMRKLFQALRPQFDLIFIDCPAGIGRSMKNTLGIADETIIVCTADDVSMRDAEQVMSMINEKNEAHPYVVFNKVDPALLRRGLIPDPQSLALALDMPLLGVIPSSPQVTIALGRHVPALDCEDREVVLQLQNIAARLEGKEIPFKNYKPGLLYRLFGGGDWI